MFSIKSIDHIVLRTDRFEKMLKFYCNVLGGTVEKEQPALRLTQIRMGDNLVDLVEVDNPLVENNPNLDHFCLRISPFDLETLTKYLEQHNITITEQGMRYGAQGMGYSIYIKDPQGNGIELREVK